MLQAPHDTPTTEDDGSGLIREAALEALRAPRSLEEALRGAVRGATRSVGQWSPAGAWTATDAALHPRWPSNTPGGLGGQFMRVGQHFVFHGHEWEIANIVQGKIIAHEASGNQKHVESRIFDPADTGGPKTELTGATRGAPRKVKGGGKEGHSISDVTIIDPYVDPSTHDPSLPLPEDGKVSAEQWKAFGRAEQLHYIDLQARYGKHTQHGAAELIKKAYNDYEAEIQNLVSSAYASQYSSSSGFTISLVEAFQSGSLEQQRERFEKAKELQSLIRDAYAWDLYNRAKAPDLTLFHKSNAKAHWWQKFIGSKTERIFSGLSQTFHWRPGSFGHTTIATQVSIRHIVMATWVAGPKKGAAKQFSDSGNQPGEREMSVPYQIQVDARSMTFDNDQLTSSQKKWLESTTGQSPMGGSHLETFREWFKGGEAPPIPPPLPMVNIGGADSIKPHQAALDALAEYGEKLPEISSSVTPEILGATGLPFAHTDENGNPKLVSALDAGYKEGDYMMGKQGTLYWIGPNPTDTSGYGLTIHKLVSDGKGGLKANGETMVFDNTHQNYKLLANVPPPPVEGAVFDPEAWVYEDAKPKPIMNHPVGVKFNIDGTPYEKIGESTPESTPIKDLSSGLTGTLNSDYQTILLEPKEGYVPEGLKVKAKKGMSLAYDGKKHIVTAVKKDGTISIKPSTGGKVIQLAEDDDVFKGLFDHDAWELGGKTTAGNIRVGQLFHSGGGKITIRPRKVVGNDESWVYWEDLATGESGKFLKKKKVTELKPIAGTEEEPLHPTGTVQPGPQPPPQSETPQPGPPSVTPTPKAVHHGYTEGDEVEIQKFSGKTWEATVVGSIEKAGKPYLKVSAPTKDGPKVYTVKLEKVLTPPPNADGKGGKTTADVSVGSVKHNLAVDGLPDIIADGPGFDAYKSSHGTGGKIKHHRIKEMPIGTVFVDKSGKKFKVQTAGPTPIITDGEANYTIDGDLRGKAMGGESLDGPPPPGSEPTPAPPEEVSPLDEPWWNTDEYMPNDGSDGEPVYDLGSMPIGTTYPAQHFKGSVVEKVSETQISIGGDAPENFDPEYVPDAFKLPSGEPDLENEPSGSPGNLAVALAAGNPYEEVTVPGGGKAMKLSGGGYVATYPGGEQQPFDTAIDAINYAQTGTVAEPKQPPKQTDFQMYDKVAVTAPTTPDDMGKVGTIVGYGNGQDLLVQIGGPESEPLAFQPDEIEKVDPDTSLDPADQGVPALYSNGGELKVYELPVGSYYQLQNGVTVEITDAHMDGQTIKPVLAPGGGPPADANPVDLNSTDGNYVPDRVWIPGDVGQPEADMDKTALDMATALQSETFNKLAVGDTVKAINGATVEVTGGSITWNQAADEAHKHLGHELLYGMTLNDGEAQPTKVIADLPIGSIYQVTDGGSIWEVIGQPKSNASGTDVLVKGVADSNGSPWPNAPEHPANGIITPHKFTLPKAATGPSAVSTVEPGHAFVGGDGATWIVASHTASGMTIAKGPDDVMALPSTTAIDGWNVPEPSLTVGETAIGANFDGADGSYKVVAHSMTVGGTTIVKHLGTDDLVPIENTTPLNEVSLGTDPSPEPELVADLSPGDEFENGDGTALKVVSAKADGTIVYGTPNGTEMLTAHPSDPISSLMPPPPSPADDAIPEGVEAVEDLSDIGQKLKAEFGYDAIKTPLPWALAGYKSAWGSGGKYKHEMLVDLGPGTKFRDTKGDEYVWVEALTGGKVLLWFPAQGLWVEVDASTRVRKL